ncbi:MAG: hypothetical protein IJ573_08910 [Clostridia bacterium]|nr:hypothetical protein [Clostridia bacterium]
MRLRSAIEKTDTGKRLLKDRRFRLILFAVMSMGWNLVYAVFNALLGLIGQSAWFAVMSVYYAVLGLMKLLVLSSRGKLPGKSTAKRTMTVTGTGMFLLAGILSVIVKLTISNAVGRSYPIAVMIAIAAFTFGIVIKAIVNAVQAHRHGDLFWVMLRNISLASAAGSVLALERSMMSTFGSSTDSFTYTMEGVSGLVSFLFVVLLGTSMIVRAIRMGEGKDA